MRTSITLFSLLSVLVASAQVDINKMIQDRMKQQDGGQPGSTGTPGGTTMQDDNDPFVPNEFSGSFRMEMHHYKNGEEAKHSPTNMLYWSTSDMTLMRNAAAEQQGQEMKILTDLKGKWTYTLMTDKKGKKTAMKSRKQKVTTATDARGNKKPPVITKTKETRVIEGRTCTKVIAVSEDGTWTGWMADDLKSPFLDMARNVGGSKQGGDEMSAAQDIDGMVLEFEWVTTDGVSRTTAFVRDLVVGKVDGSTFSLDGYEVMEMPSFGR